MKKILIIITLIISQLAVVMPSQAGAGTRLTKKEQRAERQQARKEQQQQFKVALQDMFAQLGEQKQAKKEAAPQYGREFFLASPLWLIFGIVLALTGLVMLFFGGIISIAGGSIMGAGIAIILSFLIYRAVR